jgi:hypothetical protein
MLNQRLVLAASEVLSLCINVGSLSENPRVMYDLVLLHAVDKELIPVIASTKAR